MDATLEKSCLEEISYTVLDSQQKISVRSISNNYGLNFLDAVKILQQWIDENSSKANLLKEFIVRGIDTKREVPFITVANENRLKKIQDKTDQFSSVLYAVEVASESSRSLNIPEEQEFKVINLPLKSETRDVQVFTPAVPSPAAPSIKQEPKSKINSMFGSVAKSVQQTPKPIKEEKQSPPVNQETNKVSPSQKSPTKVSPSKKKDAKKPVNGKASIASFFSNKPSTAKTTPSTPTPSTITAELKNEKTSPQEEKSSEKDKSINGKHDDTPRWKRMISDESDGDDVIPNTPQETKEPKKRGGKKPLASKRGSVTKGNPSKRSRILQVVDSSEEEEEDTNMREPEEEKTIKFDTDDEDVQMVENGDRQETKQLSPEKPVENDSNSLNRKGRAKVKKLVTRNYMDDEGYMTTVKEYVMVSEDEVENDTENNHSSAKKTSAENSKESAENVKSKSDSKLADKKPSKVTPPAAKTKQGSIMSFFTKK